MSSNNGKERLIIIDGYGFVFRAYHSMPTLTNPKGVPIGAVFGFTSMLMKLLADMKPTYAVVIFDYGRKNFRHDLYPAYKANRPPAPEDLKPQFPLVREAARALNLPILEQDNYEADDIIATLAKRAEHNHLLVNIVSSDKDLMQLIDGNITMYDPIKNKVIGTKEVEEKFGVPPSKLLDVLSMIGDSSDNVPGIPGIGPKTAVELINQYGTLDAVLERANEIKQDKRRQTIIDNKDQALLSRQLITLCETVPIESGLEDFKVKGIDAYVAANFLMEHGFKTLASRLNNLPKVANNNNSAPVVNQINISAVNCEYITNKAEIIKFLSEKEEKTKLVIYIQYESSNSQDIAGIGIALDKNAVYIPVAKEGDLFTPEGIAIKDVFALIKEKVKDNAYQLVTHDAKNLLHEMGKYDAEVNSYDDIMLISFLLGSGLHDHGLDELISHHLEKTPSMIETKTKFSTLSQEKITEYIGEKVTDILELHSLLKSKLLSERMVALYEREERPLVKVLAEMEKVGVKVDKEKLNSLSEEFSKKLSELEKQIFKEAGCEFNVGSPKQLGEVLFQNMGLPGRKMSKTGAYSTGADILEGLSEQGFTIADNLLNWRQLSKLKNTYTDALVKQIDPKTGRIHTNFSMASVVTGRLSSSDPNLQNIPIRTEEGNKIREAFIAAPGYKLVSADYSQIELRILAHIAKIEHLIDAFKHGKDIHTITASQIFGIPEVNIDSQTRRKAKAINFGIIYGISAFGLARQLGIERADASAYIKAYFREYPGIEHYMEVTKEFARKSGYVESLFGRRCYVKGINDKNPMMRNFAERAAINAPMQGTAADIIKKAMVKLSEEIGKAGFGTRMILQVHDELLFEVPEAEVDKLLPSIKKVMENVVILDVPLTVGVNIGQNWAEIH
jgi:DNA polymerase-1